MVAGCARWSMIEGALGILIARSQFVVMAAVAAGPDTFSCRLIVRIAYYLGTSSLAIAVGISGLASGLSVRVYHFE